MIVMGFGVVFSILIKPSEDLRITTIPNEVYVIDGDTVAIGSQRIRIIGIDTPELNAACVAERRAAQEARQAAISMIENAARVELHETGAKDRYGRSLGDLKLDGVFFGERMLREGHGVRYRAGGRPNWC